MSKLVYTIMSRFPYRGASNGGTITYSRRNLVRMSTNHPVLPISPRYGMDRRRPSTVIRGCARGRLGRRGSGSSPAWPSVSAFWVSAGRLRSNFVAAGASGGGKSRPTSQESGDVGQSCCSGNKQIGRATHRIGEMEMPRKRYLLGAVMGVLITVSAGGGAIAQKSGGILRVYSADSPPGLNIYEQATPWGQGPLMSVYNNLILFDQHIAQNSLETIVPDLASRWEWNEDGTGLTFTLRQGVKWHDGQPFTAKDVLCTVDLMLDKAAQKVRFNPRKSSFSNLDTVSANGDYEVTFHLKRRQPAFPMLLADGFAAITPCHQTP